MDEAGIMDMKEVAELKKDPFYRLTANVQEASKEESERK
jgi:hypothetical protein